MPKRGSVFRNGSIQRFVDFPVDSSWIFNMVEADKIDYLDTRSELIQCGKRLARWLAYLDCWYKQKQEKLVDDMVSKAQVASGAQLSAFPRWPVPDAWLGEVSKPMLPRKRSLVMHGPSRMGKTEFIRGMFPLVAVFELIFANLKDIS